MYFSNCLSESFYCRASFVIIYYKTDVTAPRAVPRFHKLLRRCEDAFSNLLTLMSDCDILVPLLNCNFNQDIKAVLMFFSKSQPYGFFSFSDFSNSPQEIKTVLSSLSVSQQDFRLNVGDRLLFKFMQLTSEFQIQIENKRWAIWKRLKKGGIPWTQLRREPAIQRSRR